ncbi:hypothetical protein [Nocardioides sp. CFH 31398]|uniref:arsenate reductase/protein-tyrosine-phosphatase family protein n=1 Tax=Nocardioides sp. CFH 31398 TaxID=2919579 RepID=UPI001F06ABCA|nr:hypothetical protein [Nocardioides sp. CFH 31398]MCH1865988.1 hypothetical protein [Nocardioides sp. CFH 31398]
MDVLFVCTANICRSAFMERWAAHAARGTGLRFASAGTHGVRDSTMDEEMLQALQRRGVDGSTFRSRRLNPRMVADADLVLTASREHRDFALEDSPGAFRKVLTLGQAVDAARQLPADVEPQNVLAELARHRGGADASSDVADPYRRGPEAAEACATTVVDMLDALLPVLAGRPAAAADRSIVEP